MAEYYSWCLKRLWRVKFTSCKSSEHILQHWKAGSRDYGAIDGLNIKASSERSCKRLSKFSTRFLLLVFISPNKTAVTRLRVRDAKSRQWIWDVPARAPHVQVVSRCSQFGLWSSQRWWLTFKNEEKQQNPSLPPLLPALTHHNNPRCPWRDPCEDVRGGFLEYGLCVSAYKGVFKQGVWVSYLAIK